MNWPIRWITSCLENNAEGMAIFQVTPNKKNLILTGFMGTGKTVVGKILAAELGRIFIDTDMIIENEKEMTVTQIFEQHGEKYFRNLESDLILKLQKYSPGSLVVATGGGAVLRKKNVDNLLKHGLIILLFATPEEIVSRISKTEIRPLLSGEVTVEKVNIILEDRKDCYKSHAVSFNTTGHSPAQIARAIISYLKQL